MAAGGDFGWEAGADVGSQGVKFVQNRHDAVLFGEGWDGDFYFCHTFLTNIKPCDSTCCLGYFSSHLVTSK